MELMEVKTAVDGIAKAVEALRATHTQEIIKVKGDIDVLTKDKINKMNDSIDALTEFKQKAEIAMSRTYKGGDGGESKEDGEYKAAFVDYMRKGRECPTLEQKAMSVGVQPDGGFLVTPTMSSQITKIIYESSPLRQLASVQVIGTDSLEFMQDIDELNGGWVSENQARPETNTPQLGKRTINVHEFYAQPKATQKLLDDANVNIEQWLAEKVADKFGRIEAAAFITGDGNGKPHGILGYPNVNQWGAVERIISGVAGGFNADSLMRLLYGLKESYASNSSFLMNRQTVREVRLIKDTTGQYIWQPGLQAGQPEALLGRPIYQAKDMPTGATNGTFVNGTLAMAFGDFRQAYQIVDRAGIQTLRDPFTEKPFVKFYSTKRVGGGVLNFEAYKLLQIGV
jgi:HK97 family phage major capsid protein